MAGGVWAHVADGNVALALGLYVVGAHVPALRLARWGWRMMGAGVWRE